MDINSDMIIHPTTLDRLVCRLQYSWSRQYRPYISSSKYEFGSAIHYALEKYYGENANLLQAFYEWIKLHQGHLDEKHRLLGTTMLSNYLLEYQNKDPFTVISVEQEAARKVPAAEPDGPTYYVGAIIDGIVWHEALGKYFVLEHKTFETFYPITLDLNHQFVIEKYVAEGILKKPVAGVIYNGLRKSVRPGPTTKLFERHIIYVNQSQTKIALERIYWTMKAIHSPDFLIFPEPAVMKCNMCEFKAPCLNYQKGEDYQFMLDNVFQKREDKEDEKWS